MGAHFQRGLLLYEQSRYEQAEQELRLELAEAPNDGATHGYLALVLAMQDKVQPATEEAKQAIHLEPDEPFGHYVLATALHLRNRFDEAVASIQEAIRLDPDDASAHALLAHIRLEQRRWTEALAAADAALARDPEHTGAANARALALVKLGRQAEAGAALGETLAREPEDALTHANQGWALLHEGNHAKALEHFREALRLDPTLEFARAGIVESLKARNLIYGWILRYFLWMGRLSEKAQWGVLIGGYLAYRGLRSVARQYPDLAPYVIPLLVAYGLFAFLTWIADPLFNLLLRLDRFGRLALSREQIVASNWVGACLLAAAAGLTAGLVLKSTPALVGAAVCVVLLLPLSATFQCSAGWPRKTMATYTLLMACAGMGAVALLATMPKTAIANGLLILALLGAVLSGWVANGLMMVTPKR